MKQYEVNYAAKINLYAMSLNCSILLFTRCCAKVILILL